jgi:hypothetical protein
MAVLTSLLVLALAGTPLSAAAQSGEGTEETQERLRVFLLTMDQGDEVWELFGHNALVIRNETTGEDLAWNWGLFNFEDVDFIPRFLRGTMRYTMGPAPTRPFVDSYVRADRSVYSNEVFLSQEQARALDEFVRWNYLPENRPYIYDYFRDNCSTRVRDALDLVLDGAIRDAFHDAETDLTYRWHTRRLVQVTGWVDQGLSFLLGTRGDHPRTEWEAMFIPMELMRLLEGMEVPFGDEGRGPLLGPREVLYESTRPPTPEAPAPFSLLWVAAGLAGAGLLVGLGTATRRGRGWGRVVLGAVGVAWALPTGVLGAILVVSWFTDHVFIHRNVNILYASPLGLLLAGALLVALFQWKWWDGRAGRLARLLALLVLIGSLLGVILQITTLVHQGNGEVVAVALPVNLALAWSLLAAGSPRRVRGGGLHYGGRGG